MTFLTDARLRLLARARGFNYTRGSDVPELNATLRAAERDLRERTHRSPEEQRKLAAAVQAARNRSTTSDEAIACGYDEEYGRGQYGYASAMLIPEGFTAVTGIEAKEVRGARIIDIGAGSDEFLRFCRDTLGAAPERLHGTDVSESSGKIIASDGFAVHVGRLESLSLPERSFDLAYLSYFIDYDTDQQATFSAAIDLLADGSTLVLEGWFPVRPFALKARDAQRLRFITKGRSAAQDIALVADAFERLGREKGRRVALAQVLRARRFVASHYGFHALPSYFLTFRVTEGLQLGAS